MIEWSKTKKGDVLMVTSQDGHTGPEPGSLLRVAEVYSNGIIVEDEAGESHEFANPAGAAQLEHTERQGTFPADGEDK